MANELEKRLGHIRTPLNVSVLGCVVNGIGEGKEADIGIAGGEGVGILFKKGKLIKKVPIAELMERLIDEVELLAQEKAAEEAGQTPQPVNGNGDANAEQWEALKPELHDQPTTIREIPVLPNKR